MPNLPTARRARSSSSWVDVSRSPARGNRGTALAASQEAYEETRAGK